MFRDSIWETEQHVFTKVRENISIVLMKDGDKSICLGKNKGVKQPGMPTTNRTPTSSVGILIDPLKSQLQEFSDQSELSINLYKHRVGGEIDKKGRMILTAPAIFLNIYKLYRAYLDDPRNLKGNFKK